MYIRARAHVRGRAMAVSCGLRLCFLALALCIVCGIGILWLYDQQRLRDFPRTLSAARLEPELKSGDLLLFQARDAGLARRVAMFGRFTHVGMLFRRSADGLLFVLDFGELRRMSVYPRQIADYENEKAGGSTARGLVALRRLLPPLSPAQQRALERSVAAFRRSTLCNKDGSAPLVEAAMKERVKALTDRFPIYQ